MTARPNFRARQLARELSRLRRQASLTQEEAGRPARFSVKKMSRIETGQLPDYNGLRVLLDRYGVPINDWEPYIRMWELAQDKGWWHSYGLDDHNYVSMEQEASEIRELEPSFIPGLLQTEQYMRMAFATGNMSKALTETNVEVRLRRQQRLSDDPPLHLHAIIDEAALTQGIDRAVMREQLLHLIKSAENSALTLQVIPRAGGLHAGLIGMFMVISFPEKEDPDQLYIEHAAGSLHVEAEEKVLAASRRFDKLARQVLSPVESVDLMRGLLTDL